MLQSLNAESFAAGVAALTAQDPLLAQVVARYGPPPLYLREQGFGELVYIVLEQRIAFRTASRIYARLLTQYGELTAERFIGLAEDDLRSLGMERTKIATCRRLALEIVEGRIDLAALPLLDDGSVRRQLVAVKGIGVWTASKYLLHSLRRPDVWLRGDYPLVVVLRNWLQLDKLPTHAWAAKYAERWAGWRSVAVHILWHDYLESR